MVTMCLRHFQHPRTGRVGWYAGVDYPDPLVDNVDVEIDTVDEISALIERHQPVAIDIREHGGTPASNIDDVLAVAQDRKRLRSVVRAHDPVWERKYTITEHTEEG